MPPASREGWTWVVATEAAAGRWSAGGRVPGRLRPLAWGRAVPLLGRPGFDAAWAASGRELVLLSSGEALAFLGHGQVAALPAACVGPHTAEVARARGFRVEVEGAGGLSDLALRLVARRPRPACVLWLRGREATVAGVEALRAAAVRVEELVAYEVEPLPGFAEAVRAAPEPRAVLVGSGRAADALFGALAGRGRPLPADVEFLVPGATTASRLVARGVAEGRIRTLPAPVGG